MTAKKSRLYSLKYSPHLLKLITAGAVNYENEQEGMYGNTI